MGTSRVFLEVLLAIWIPVESEDVRSRADSLATGIAQGFVW